LYDTFEGPVSGAGSNSLFVGPYASFISSREHFLGGEDAVSNRIAARPITNLPGLALDTELSRQTFETAPDRA
jgi:hypothetical protein